MVEKLATLSELNLAGHGLRYACKSVAGGGRKIDSRIGASSGGKKKQC